MEDSGLPVLPSALNMPYSGLPGPLKSDVQPSRQRAAYRYSDARLVIVWHSSVPLDDDEAFDYAEIVRTWGVGEPRFLEAVDFGELDYRGLGRIEYDDEYAESDSGGVQEDPST